VPALLDWLLRHTLPDGGLPFALPMADPAGSAPFWTGADPTVSSLQITSQIAAHAHRLAAVRPEVADHPWLRAATEYCLTAIRAIEQPHAYELLFSLHFLDAVAGRVPEAAGLVDRLGRHVPDDGVLPVQGGADGEVLRPASTSPDPAGASRRLFRAGVVDADLERLAADQQDDGGWRVDFPSYSPVAAVEWRGYATVDAIAVLRRNGLL
jgi:hypothetical protein